jgi:hypothetical protein
VGNFDRMVRCDQHGHSCKRGHDQNIRADLLEPSSDWICRHNHVLVKNKSGAGNSAVGTSSHDVQVVGLAWDCPMKGNRKMAKGVKEEDIQLRRRSKPLLCRVLTRHVHPLP